MVFVERGLYGALEVSPVKVDGWRKEYQYSGKSGNEIRVSYREFAFYKGRTLARPAFSRELTFDLADSDTVGFDNITLKVHAASNLQIDFTVISSGEL